MIILILLFPGNYHDKLHMIKDYNKFKFPYPRAFILSDNVGGVKRQHKTNVY